VTHSYVRRTGKGAVLVGGFAVAATLFATTAQANVTNLTVGGNNSGSFAVGTAYTVSGSCDGQSPVTFTDNGQSIGTASPVNGAAAIQWTPQGTGNHTIGATGCDTAGQTDAPAQAAITVGQGSGQGGILGQIAPLLGQLGPLIQLIQPLLSSLSAQ